MDTSVPACWIGMEKSFMSACPTKRNAHEFRETVVECKRWHKVSGHSLFGQRTSLYAFTGYGLNFTELWGYFAGCFDAAPSGALKWRWIDAETRGLGT